MLFETQYIEKIRSACNLKTFIDDQSKFEKLKKLSTIFGILRTDITRDFTIFEGPFDSFFWNNSIALAGIDKETFAFDELPTVKYFLDNDTTGRTRSIEKIKKGKRVFLWSKYLRDTKLDKYNIKDLNDLVLKLESIKLSTENKKELYKKINEYFSSDSHDIIWI